jgi:hypothetical protein
MLRDSTRASIGGKGAPEVAVHQALLFDVINNLQQEEFLAKNLFTDERWQLVRSSAPRRSWLSILHKIGFPCGMEFETGCRIDLVSDLVEIDADATRNQLLRLTMWLATSMRSCQHDGVPADRGPLTWAPVRLNVDNIVFDTSSLGAELRMHGNFQVTT